MGLVIGRGGSTLRRINVDTGAKSECKDGKIYVSGSKESRLKAILKFKRIVEVSIKIFTLLVDFYYISG